MSTRLSLLASPMILTHDQSSLHGCTVPFQFTVIWYSGHAQAIRLDPTFAEAHHNLGLALLDQNDVDGAIASFREAIRLKPTHFEARSGKF